MKYTQRQQEQEMTRLLRVGIEAEKDSVIQHAKLSDEMVVRLEKHLDELSKRKKGSK